MDLSRESSWVAIVFDTESQLVLILSVEKTHGEGLKVRITLLLECFDISLILFLCHGVANRVMSEYAVGSFKTSHKEVLSIKVIAFVESFPIWNSISADVFENYSLCCLVYSLAQLCVHSTNNRADCIMLLIVSNGKTTDYILCIG